MKKNFISIMVMCFLLISLLIVQVSAAEYSYFGGCADCRGNVVAYCDGPIEGSPFNSTHEYGGFLIWGKDICNYKEHVHATTEYCRVDPTHVNPGDDVTGEKEHECGQEDDVMCTMHHEAYSSDS